MGVVAVRAEQVSLVTVPIAGSPAVNAGTPIAKFLAVTLTAKQVGLLERDLLAAREVKLIAIVGVMTIQTPTVLLIVLEHDVVVEVGQFSPLAVDRQIGMTIGAREYPVREWWFRDLELCFRHIGSGRVRRTQPQSCHS